MRARILHELLRAWENYWKCFVSSVYDKETRKWTCFKRAHVDLVDKSKLFN